MCICDLTGDDYSAGPYNVTIYAGDTSASFNISITDDNVLEENETFRLVITPESLPNLVSRGISATTTVIIKNDDGQLSIKHKIYSNFLSQMHSKPPKL